MQINLTKDDDEEKKKIKIDPEEERRTLNFHFPSCMFLFEMTRRLK
jgi:hypothetical protein